MRFLVTFLKYLIIYLFIFGFIYYWIYRGVLMEGEGETSILVFLLTFPLITIFFTTRKTIISINKKKYRVQQLEEEQSEIEQLKARITDLENKEDSNQKPQEESQGNTERIVKVEKAVKRGFIMSSLMFFVKLIIPFDIFGDDA